jgi:hypothetical protein
MRWSNIAASRRGVDTGADDAIGVLGVHPELHVDENPDSNLRADSEQTPPVTKRMATGRWRRQSLGAAQELSQRGHEVPPPVQGRRTESGITLTALGEQFARTVAAAGHLRTRKTTVVRQVSLREQTIGRLR